MSIHRFYKNHPDCNRCEPGGKCFGMFNSELCRRHIPPKDTWMLVELALAHPTSLNQALKDLPFDVSLDFYLR